MNAWETKAHALIAEMARASYLQSNTGKRKHRPYSIPPLAQALVTALGDHDRARAEETCKALFHVHTVIPAFTKGNTQ